MAKTKRIKITKENPEKILNEIFESIFSGELNEKRRGFFSSPALKKLGDYYYGLKPDSKGTGSTQEKRFYESRKISGNIIKLTTLPLDITRLKNNIQEFEKSYITSNLARSKQVLEYIVKLGQELLRRMYISKLLDPDKKIETSGNFELIVETGAAAIQILNRAPRSPYYAFRKFNSKNVPITAHSGIEILSSGAFPDWFNDNLRSLRDSKQITRSGFENVLDAVYNTPRSRVMARAIREKRLKNFFAFPEFLRTMLDLELMRLGQATTPGTYRMLLNSYYYGAMLVDHSTNVSEQVQIIYAEENWKAMYSIENSTAPKEQAKCAFNKLKDFFTTKAASPIKRDHPRTARIEFYSDIHPKSLKIFFKEFGAMSKILNLNPEVHEILPVLRFKDSEGRKKNVKSWIKALKSIGFKKLTLIADYTRHYPGLLQYFDNEKITNQVIDFAAKNKVKLIDGKTVDMVATSNKAIEAAAGAIMSGHGSIKVGLLGLTYEQMSEFIDKFKKGIGSKYNRRNNQLIIFIGLVDEPIVSEKKVYTNAKEISEKFIELMREKYHDMLLLDTMHKGKTDKRLVNEKDINKDDKKGGHLTFGELKKMILKAKKMNGKYPGVEIWVAGSYTEEQTYQASMASAAERPGLICLGGAERSFGGIRLDPKDAFEVSENSRNNEDKRLAALIQSDSDISFILSRDNKLARDAGLVTGDLKRAKKKEAAILEKMRKDYLEVKCKYFTELGKFALTNKVSRKNIDYFETLSGKFAEKNNEIKKLKADFTEIRRKYVDLVSDLMYELYSDKWFK